MSYFFCGFETQCKDNTYIIRNVLLCPAMSFYVLIKVKKICFCLYLWSLFRIFVYADYVVHNPDSELIT